MSARPAFDPDAIVRDVHSRLRACGKAERRAVARSYFPTAMKVLGVTVPDLRAVVRDLSRHLKDVEPRDDQPFVGLAISPPGCLEETRHLFDLASMYNTFE